jgi:hypothetical protein
MGSVPMDSDFDRAEGVERDAAARCSPPLARLWTATLRVPMISEADLSGEGAPPWSGPVMSIAHVAEYMDMSVSGTRKLLRRYRVGHVSGGHRTRRYYLQEINRLLEQLYEVSPQARGT